MIRTLLRSGAVLGLLAAGAPVQGRAQGEPSWRVVELSRQLRDTLPQRVRVQYGAGRVDVRGTADPLLYSMHLRYDEARTVPLHRYDADQHAVVLGVEGRGAGGIRATGRGEESGELRLMLPSAVPLDLDLEFGGTEAALELGGLALRSLRMEFGATEATLGFASPNRVQMAELEINVGAAGLTATRLANANANRLRVRGGVGSVDLDFGGQWSRDLDVVTRLAVGKLTLRIPPSVGLRLEVQRVAAGFNHVGLVKRDDAWYSPNYDTAPHKLRVRAETFFGGISVLPSTP
jgi:hypothetical protein